jgi:hypothetical protein
MRTDRDIALRAGGCNNRERRGKGCDRGIDGVERGGVVLLWSQLPTSPTLPVLTAYNSPVALISLLSVNPSPMKPPSLGEWMRRKYWLIGRPAANLLMQAVGS